MMEGAWLIVDEIDTLRPDLMNLFKPALEDEARLLIPEYGGKIIIAHPDFRIIATANTFGRGDDTGLYVSTMTQSKADLRRFNCFIKMDYLPEKTEIEIVVKTFKGEVTEKEALSFVKVANDIRAAYTAGKVDVPFSIDELLNWVDTWISVNDLHVAANLCFLNACAPDVVVAINAIIDQHWDEGEEPADPNAQVKP
jgi:cobaltochelatase CobS